jgi:hypothetical protein
VSTTRPVEITVRVSEELADLLERQALAYAAPRGTYCAWLLARAADYVKGNPLNLTPEKNLRP